MCAHRTVLCAIIVAWSGAVTSGEAMIQCGAASWYDESAGTQSADGGRVDPSALAAAHRSLPFGTARAAAEALAFTDSGITPVRISTLEPGVALAEDAATGKCP